MNNNNFQKQLIEFRKGMSEFRKTSRIVECFHHNKSECEGNIKSSHSIQRNGRLSIIEGSVNGNQLLYTFTEAEIDEHTPFKTLKPIGKKTASTFFGFCDFHDIALFSDIENFKFDETYKHCFLHSYRSFAHSYHRKKEELKAYKTKSKFTDKMPKWYLDESIKGLEMGVKDGEEIKQNIDRLLDLKAYDELDYFTYIIPAKYPIACSSVISPFFTFSGRPFNNHNDPNKPFSFIMLTVLPDVDQTIVIFACFPEDKEAVSFIDELEQLHENKLAKAISTILITCSENTFFAPALWDALGKNGQRALCDELHKTASTKHAPKFKYSKINFFDSRFSAKRLGIS